MLGVGSLRSPQQRAVAGKEPRDWSVGRPPGGVRLSRVPSKMKADGWPVPLPACLYLPSRLKGRR